MGTCITSQSLKQRIAFSILHFCGSGRWYTTGNCTSVLCFWSFWTLRSVTAGTGELLPFSALLFFLYCHLRALQSERRSYDVPVRFQGEKLYEVLYSDNRCKITLFVLPWPYITERFSLSLAILWLLIWYSLCLEEKQVKARAPRDCKRSKEVVAYPFGWQLVVVSDGEDGEEMKCGKG